MAKRYETADQVIEHLAKGQQISLYNANLLAIEILRLRAQLNSNRAFEGWEPKA